MLKKTGIALMLAFACIGAAHAQVLPPGFEVNVNVETNAFQLERTDKSDSELRKEAAEDIGQKITLPFGGHDWYNNTGLSLSNYNPSHVPVQYKKAASSNNFHNFIVRFGISS